MLDSAVRIKKNHPSLKITSPSLPRLTEPPRPKSRLSVPWGDGPWLWGGLCAMDPWILLRSRVLGP